MINLASEYASFKANQSDLLVVVVVVIVVVLVVVVVVVVVVAIVVVIGWVVVEDAVGSGVVKIPGLGSDENFVA